MNDLLDSIIRLLLIAILVSILLSSRRGSTTDDSDSPTEKSGVHVCTDYKTGVQYLETRDGGITPRLMPDGTLAVVDVQQPEASTP